MVIGKDIPFAALRDGASFYDEMTGRGPDIFRRVLCTVYNTNAEWCESHATFVDMYPCTSTPTVVTYLAAPKAFVHYQSINCKTTLERMLANFGEWISNKSAKPEWQR